MGEIRKELVGIMAKVKRLHSLLTAKQIEKESVVYGMTEEMLEQLSYIHGYLEATFPEED